MFEALLGVRGVFRIGPVSGGIAASFWGAGDDDVRASLGRIFVRCLLCFDEVGTTAGPSLMFPPITLGFGVRGGVAGPSVKLEL